jgi:hypothetical protein
MKAAAAQRPELLLGPNPFIECLPPVIPFNELPAALKRSALQGLEWRSIEPAYRDSLLESARQHFVAARNFLEPAAGIQILFRRAMVLRNPLAREERRRVNQVGLIEQPEALRKLPALDGAGMLLSATTGAGKTALIHRMLELVAPDQIIDHGSSEACGWYRLRQCTYLCVDFPSNGTRGALLKRVLERLDEALGTSYFDDHKKTANLDSLLVVVCKLITLHRVALVVIDEKQQSNFVDSPWRIEFVLFYLTLMNLGVSVVLSGNPLAFDHLNAFSQVLRRFSVGGITRLDPAATRTEKWWALDFIPQAREFSLVETWDIDPMKQAELEFSNSAGIPGLFMPFHIEAQRSALRRGGSSATVTIKDYEAAQASPRFRALRRVAQAVQHAPTDATGEFQDIPAMEPKGKAGHASQVNKPPSIPSDQSMALIGRLLRGFTTTQTRKANALLQQLKTLKGLPPDDIRMLGLSNELIAELDKLSPPEKKKSRPVKDDPESAAG